jgi:hypothetical protein
MTTGNPKEPKPDGAAAVACTDLLCDVASFIDKGEYRPIEGRNNETIPATVGQQ